MSLGYVATYQRCGVRLFYAGRGWTTNAVNARVYRSRAVAWMRALRVAGGNVVTAWI